VLSTTLNSCLIAALTAAGPTPDEMKAMPGVATVEVAVQADNPTLRIVHILDWHHVPRDAFAADMRDALGEVEDEQIDEAYAKHLDRVEDVQKAQRAILPALAQRHGVRAVYIQGPTEGDVALFEMLVGVYRRRGGRELGLRVGAAGQLVAEGKLKRVLPIEDAGALKAANPVSEDGEVRVDEKLQEAREDAMVRRLLKVRGLAVVVLGGGHDLSDNVRRLGDGRCEYVRLRREGIRAGKQYSTRWNLKGWSRTSLDLEGAKGP